MLLHQGLYSTTRGCEPCAWIWESPKTYLDQNARHPVLHNCAVHADVVRDHGQPARHGFDQVVRKHLGSRGEKENVPVGVRIRQPVAAGVAQDPCTFCERKVSVLYIACIGRCMDNSQSNRSEQLPALEVKQSGGFGKRARPYLDVSIPVQLPPRPRQIRPVPRHDDFELGQVVQLAGFL